MGYTFKVLHSRKTPLAKCILLYVRLCRSRTKTTPTVRQTANFLRASAKCVRVHYVKLGLKLKGKKGSKKEPAHIYRSKYLSFSEKDNKRKGKGASEKKSLKDRYEARWRQMAEVLCHTLQETEGLRYGRHIPKWADQFRKLHVEDGVEVDMIWTVLKWYCRMRGKLRTLPRCYTANMFRGAFGWIYEKWQQENPSANLEDTSWMDLARKTVSKCDLEGRISVESLARLYSDVQSWREKVRKVLDSKYEDAGTQDKLRIECLQELIDDEHGVSFPEQVGLYIVEQSRNWKNWKGDLGLFSPGGSYFISFLTRLYRDRFGRHPDKWVGKLLFNA